MLIKIKFQSSELITNHNDSSFTGIIERLSQQVLHVQLLSNCNTSLNVWYPLAACTHRPDDVNWNSSFLKNKFVLPCISSNVISVAVKNIQPTLTGLWRADIKQFITENSSTEKFNCYELLDVSRLTQQRQESERAEWWYNSWPWGVLSCEKEKKCKTNNLK